MTYRSAPHGLGAIFTLLLLGAVGANVVAALAPVLQEQRLRRPVSFQLPDPRSSPNGPSTSWVSVSVDARSAMTIVRATRTRIDITPGSGMSRPIPALDDARRLPVPSWTIDLIRHHFDKPARGPITIVVSGWPLPAWGGAYSDSGVIHALPLGKDEPRAAHPRLFPLRPLWPGLLCDTLVHTALLGLIGGLFLILVRQSRTTASTCPRCHYDLQGLLTPVCPECGSVIPSSRDAKTAGASNF